MTIFIIYIIGFLISYYITRKITRNLLINNFENDNNYSWKDVKDNFMASLFSWLVVIFVFLQYLIDKTKVKTVSGLAQFYLRIKNTK